MWCKLWYKTSNKKEGVILKEFQLGYKYHEKIIRHAKVVVSKKKWEIITKY